MSHFLQLTIHHPPVTVHAVSGRAEGENRKANVTPNTFVFFLPAFALLMAGPAAAASIEEAYRIVDRAEPLRCEILALEERLKRATEGSEEYTGLAAEIDEAKARLKMHYQATLFEYIDVMKMLPFEERKRVYRYSNEVAGRCAAKACGGAPCPPNAEPGPSQQSH